MIRTRRGDASLLCLLTLACGLMPLSSPAEPLMLGLAYQPYVGHWNSGADNPYAPGIPYTPAFSSYAGASDPAHPATSLLHGRRDLDLRFDATGTLMAVDARGWLTCQPDALRNATPAIWSQRLVRAQRDGRAQPAVPVDHAAAVYRQLAFLTEQAGGAPLTLTTYSNGFAADYWRELAGRGYAALPVWTRTLLRFHRPDATTPQTDEALEEHLFYLPPTAAYVRATPAAAIVETSGTPGRDLALQAVHLRVLEPATKGAPGAALNPGFCAGDANAQVALAAAVINARAGAHLLRIKLGVGNLAVAGSLINDRMRFAILGALAQAQAANQHFAGTVTHLIISNEYARVEPPDTTAPTSTQQVLAMLRYAREQVQPGGAFAGLKLQLGARTHQLRRADPASSDPAVQAFTRDVAALAKTADVLMENIYPSPEVLTAARDHGDWRAFFDPDSGELTRQWQALVRTIRQLDPTSPPTLMIGEIGHPTAGIPFNLPPADLTAIGTAARPQTGSIAAAGTALFARVANPTLARAFITGAVAWSRQQGVQIHLFEAFDEPHKASPILPAADAARAAALLSPSGPYGAEAFYGLFGYSGVADSTAPAADTRPPTPTTLLATLPAGMRWAGPYSGQLFRKDPGLDLGALAAVFSATP